MIRQPIWTLVVCAVVQVSGLHLAGADDQPIVVAGLRPTTNAQFGPTKTARLAEAQKLRELVGEVIQTVSHQAILGHGDLVKTAGKTYFTKFVDCRGDARCVKKVLAPVQKQASHAVYGDYAVDAQGTSKFRFRVIDLSNGQIVQHTEFSLKKKELGDHEAWERELAPLFPDAKPEEPTPVADTKPAADAIKSEPIKTETPKPVEDKKPDADAAAADKRVADAAAGPKEPVPSVVKEPVKPVGESKAFIIPQLLVNTDYSAFAGPGVSQYQRFNGTGLDAGFRLARIGLKFAGRLDSRWMFDAGAILRPVADKDEKATTSLAIWDAWLGADLDPKLRARAGQFLIPFTIDSSEPYYAQEFLEPTMTTRFITAPDVRALGVMAWGVTPHLQYQVGYINGGTGGIALGGSGDGVGRVGLRPFGSGSTMVHLGGGVRYGLRNPKKVFFDAPRLTNSTGVGGEYTFWYPVYFVDLSDEFHIVPSSEQLTVNGEFMARLGRRVEIVAEGDYVHQERREYARAFQDDTLRAGTLKGVTYYAMLALWLAGEPRVRERGLPTIPPQTPPKVTGLPTGLQFAARVEQMFLKYNSNDRSPEVDKGGLDRETDKMRIDALQLVLNAYAGKYVRMAAEYTGYYVPGRPPTVLTNCSLMECTGQVNDPPGTNQMAAPGAVQAGNFTAGTFDGNFMVASPGAHTLHQFVVRVQIAF